MTNVALVAELKSRGVIGVARWNKEKLVARLQEARDAAPAAAAPDSANAAGKGAVAASESALAAGDSTPSHFRST